MSSPMRIAPTSDPTNAPTMPPQKRSGRKIVKCQIAKPIITQPSIAISARPRSSARSPGASARPAVAAVAGAPALFRPFRLILQHEVLRGEIRGRVGGLAAQLLGVRRALSRRRALRDTGGAAGRTLPGRTPLDVEVAHELLKLF